jgi:ADP-heptose:LPS heptosyltransferase
VKRVLAIRFARLGDVLLLQPALAAIKASSSDVHLTLMTGHRCAPLAVLCPAIDDVIDVNRIAMRDGPVWKALAGMKDLAAELRARCFDAVIDFHGFRETNLLTWLSRAPVRIGMRRTGAPFLNFCFNRPAILEDKTLHVTEMFQRVAMGLDGVAQPTSAGPTIRIPEAAHAAISHRLPHGPKVALYVDAPVPDRRWPPECFAAVADQIVQQVGAAPVVLAGPENQVLVERVLKASRFSERLHGLPRLTLPELAGVIGECEMLISNDTGPMHLGPALGVPTLGLFSVGLPEHFRPLGKADQFLKGETIEEITVGQVIRETNRMWGLIDRDLRR